MQENIEKENAYVRLQDSAVKSGKKEKSSGKFLEREKTQEEEKPCVRLEQVLDPHQSRLRPLSFFVP